MVARRADFGASVESFLVKQPPDLRAIVDVLRALIDKAAPEAEASLKWGMPFYALDGEMLCAIGAHKSHVNLILTGPPGTYADPGGLLAGDGKTGRHLKIAKGEKVPTKEVAGWLKTAVARAKSG